MPSDDVPPTACPECGSIVDLVPRALYEEALETNRSLQRVIVTRDRRIAQLTTSQWTEPEASPHYPTAMEVLEFWKHRCAPRTRELGGARVQLVIDRLIGGYEKGDLTVCVLGYAARPYIRFGQRRAQGLPTEKRIDAETIFRSARMVDQGMDLATQNAAEEVEAVRAHGSAYLMQAQLGLGL